MSHHADKLVIDAHRSWNIQTDGHADAGNDRPKLTSVKIETLNDIVIKMYYTHSGHGRQIECGLFILLKTVLQSNQIERYWFYFL